jgi:hypoxanthine phosphoribosyltransferase
VPPAALAARHRAEVIFDSSAVVQAIDQVAVRLTLSVAEQNPVFVCVMNGGLAFTAALMQRCHFPMQLTYVHVGRYGSGIQGGELTWRAKPDMDLNGRHVVLVDDILDRGITMKSLQAWAEEDGALSVTTVVLLDKQIGQTREAQADFAALVCPDRYVFGWGMDFEGYWRNLPDIYALPEEEE